MGTRAITALALAGLALPVSACGSSTSSGGGSPASGTAVATCPSSATAASGTDITITATDYCFTPPSLNLVAGKEIKVTLVNAGANKHNLTVGSTDAGEAAPGATQALTLTPTGSGTVQFFCKYHKDKGMVGVVNLTGSASPPTSVPVASPSPKPYNPYGY